MVDFFKVSTTKLKNGTVEVFPKFVNGKRSDLMIRGGDFYAVWLEDKNLWSTSEDDVIHLIDTELDNYVNEHQARCGENPIIHYMWDSASGSMNAWHQYCQKQQRDSYTMLDESLIFANVKTKKRDYASKQLSYPLEDGEAAAYDKLISTLYSEADRHKIEWCIGSIFSGDSKKLQKFLVLYGGPGTGKGTVISIIQMLFEDYCSTFDAYSLGSHSAAFALEAFKDNPLVAIDADGDLSRIEDNTRLNLLVSHEPITVNEKFKSTYTNRFKTFLIMASNKAVKITDAKSGLLRRLIECSPSGEKIQKREYDRLMAQIPFELGAIATHCLNVYKADPLYYDDYIPYSMLAASNDFYGFMLEQYPVYKKDDGTTIKAAWEAYKAYCEEAKVGYPMPLRKFSEELGNYFRQFDERYTLPEGTRVRRYYSEFLTRKFAESDEVKEAPKTKEEAPKIDFAVRASIFDEECKACPAQYANADGTPLKRWERVKTTLERLDTSKLHYVKVPENHIVIDFDIPDENGEKCYERNLEAASKWPDTYAELSKSGAGIHLHYIYTGDVSKLSSVYADHIEVKVFRGGSSLRRLLTKCNDVPIATISSGLPLKGEKMVNFDGVKSENQIRTLIARNLNKEYHPATKPSIDFIYKILEDAYASGLHYDVSDMSQGVLLFAMDSTNQADACVKLYSKMKFKSDDCSEAVVNDEAPLVFYDVEVFPNLFLVNWKIAGPENKVVRLINPSPAEIEDLMRYRLVGFNCRRYDNHMLYACLIGKSVEDIYNLSQDIIINKRGFFGEAYNVSYTDVYDFLSKKQSLKKWEIELGIHHQELGLPWDQPVPKELWEKVAEYCDNDVIATEALFYSKSGQADFLAREVLADIAGGIVNDTTNTLSAKFIFQGNKKPQGVFNYRNMGDISQIDEIPFTCGNYDPEYTKFDAQNRPIFPGYEYKFGKSTYRDEEVGEGGYVYAEPGMYVNIALLDIASMHPSSAIAEQLFGPEYTKRFEEIRDTRVAIKHKEFDKARSMLGGVLVKYLTDESMADNLAQAIKIVINSVYGLTSAQFENPFRDPRNRDNIVAKRGALFMINLKHEVQNRGYTVAHIKTDSIKIPNADMAIIQFVAEYGEMYGYSFEHEAVYERMTLVNNAVYIAKYATIEHCYELYGETYCNKAGDTLKDNKKHGGEWTATGTQFQIPYVFKRCFTKEPIEFADMCETKSVSSALYLDMNEELPQLSPFEDRELEALDKAWHSDNEEDRAKVKKRYKYTDEEFGARYAELCKKEEASHDRHFVGKVGQFCPIKPDRGGGILLRATENKKTGETGFASATGANNYRWLESEVVKSLGKEDDIDRSYYDAMVDEAINTISEYGDYEWFISDDHAGIPPWFGVEDESKLFAVR